MIELTVAGDPDAAARTAAERIAAAILDARAQRGEAHVALSGGSTPAATFRLLPRLVPDWRDVHLWWGDERCVPLDEPESNYKLATDTLLAEPLDPAPTLHPLRCNGDPDAAARAYEHALRAALPGDPPRLDVALLGVGDDGHTASLFPDHPALEERERLCVAVRGGNPSLERVTFTLPLLLAVRKLVVLADGAGKAWAIGAMLAGPSPRVPASLLGEADVELIVDRTGAPA